MTSQNNYKKYKETFETADKCLHSKEMGHPSQSVSGKIHRISASREQLKTSLISNYLAESSVNYVARPDDNEKGDNKRGILSFPEASQMKNQMTHKCMHCQTPGVLLHCSGNDIENMPDSDHSFGLNGVVTQCAFCELDARRCIVKIEEEKYFYTFTTEECKHNSPRRVRASSVEKYTDNASVCNNSTIAADKQANKLKQKSKSFNKYLENNHFKNRYLQCSNESQSCFTKLCSHFKQRSMSLTMPSGRTLLNTTLNQFSSQPELQKCKSLVSVVNYTLQDLNCSFVDLKICQTNEEFVSTYLSNISSQSPNRLSRFSDECQDYTTTSNEKSDCLRQQCRQVSSTWARKNTSTKIQRIQEQLRIQMENDENKGSLNKAPITFTFGTTPHSEIKEYEPPGKRDNILSDRLQKEEKPYRQWHRMSRVLTAESKFIISPLLPNHIFRCANQKQFLASQLSLELEGKTQSLPTEIKTESLGENIEAKRIESVTPEGRTDSLAPKDNAELLVPEREITADLKTVTCPTEELVIGISPSCFDKDMLKTEHPRGNKEDLTVLANNDKIINKSSMLKTEEKNDNNEIIEMKADGKFSQNDKIFTSLSVGSAQTDSGSTSDDQSITQAEDTVTDKGGLESIESSETSSQNELNKLPVFSTDSSLPRYKSFTIKTLHNVRYKCVNEQSKDKCEVDVSQAPRFVPNNSTEKWGPFNSVSAVSQVKGPSFSEHKSKSKLETPFKKTGLYSGPKLRTAERSRKRGKSYGLLADGFDIIIGNENKATFIKEPQCAVRNISRNSSMNSSCSSKKSSLEKEYKKMIQLPSQNCSNPNTGVGMGIVASEDCLENANRNWSSDSGTAGVTVKVTSVTTPKTQTRKVFLADVANKLLQKVNRTGRRAPCNEPTQKYINVKAIKDYNGSLPGQLSFRKGQKIKQRSYSVGSSDGMSYGYYRVGRLRKKMKGLFPSNCVTTEGIDALDVSDIDSLTSSSKSVI